MTESKPDWVGCCGCGISCTTGIEITIAYEDMMALGNAYVEALKRLEEIQQRVQLAHKIVEYEEVVAVIGSAFFEAQKRYEALLHTNAS